MDAVIPANQSLSNAVDLGASYIVGFNMPSTWSPAASLTFQSSDSIDGVYKDVYDSTGAELTVTAAANRVIVDIPELASVRYLKIRSGTSAAAIPQAGNRTIRILNK